MEVKQIKRKDFDIWDSFVEESNNGTIFHKLAFLSYHEKNKFDFLNLAFYKKGSLVAVLPGGVKNNIYISPMGASYGSFAVQNVSLEMYEEIIDTFLAYCRKKKIKKILLTPPPILYYKKQNEIEKFLLEYKGFKHFQGLISNALNISSLKTEKDILESFTPMHRRAVQKSQKMGVQVKVESNLEEFYEMLLENKKKFHTVPTHTLDEVVKISKTFPENIKLFMARSKDGQPLASILLFVCNNSTALAFYISHYYHLQEYRAVNRLFYEIILWCKQRNIQWLDLGVSMDTFSKNPSEPSRSLIFFKEGIGSRGFLRTTYEYTF